MEIGGGGTGGGAGADVGGGGTSGGAGDEAGGGVGVLSPSRLPSLGTLAVDPWVLGSAAREQEEERREQEEEWREDL
jgi:hypothetical protein